MSGTFVSKICLVTILCAVCVAPGVHAFAVPIPMPTKQTATPASLQEEQKKTIDETKERIK
jgi:hypothetical protein